eukprot:11176991-Lingulodinium_polyedra.AAC.1
MLTSATLSAAKRRDARMRPSAAPCRISPRTGSRSVQTSAILAGGVLQNELTGALPPQPVD